MSSVKQMMSSVDIKSMELYLDVDRIWADMKELGYERKSDLNVDSTALNKYDCYNYGGVASAQNAADRLGLNKSSLVLDVGSGIGGPARCIANYCGAKIDGIEYQEDLAKLANELNSRCNLSDKVQVFEGSILSKDIPPMSNAVSKYDSAISFLVILHIALKV